MVSVGPSELVVQVCIPVKSVLGEGIHSFIQQTMRDFFVLSKEQYVRLSSDLTFKVHTTHTCATLQA